MFCLLLAELLVIGKPPEYHGYSRMKRRQSNIINQLHPSSIIMPQYIGVVTKRVVM